MILPVWQRNIPDDFGKFSISKGKFVTAKQAKGLSDVGDTNGCSARELKATWSLGRLPEISNA